MYSQSLRLRRIINSPDRLQNRLNDLAACFKKAGYPENMVNEITTKVLNSERDVSIRRKTDTQNDDQIRVISTYEADKNIVNAVKNSEENLNLTQSFRNINGPLFTFIKKVGPNIKCHINRLKKQQALGTKRGSAVKCSGRGCKTCRMH